MISRGLILLGVFRVLTLALDPSLSPSQYSKRNWQVEDGLPQNYVTSIVQSADGYLIVGTAGGVARFDGVRFTPILLKNGTSREWINNLLLEPQGLWIASRDAGLFYHAGGATKQESNWGKQLHAMAALRGGGFVASFESNLWKMTDGELASVGKDLTQTDLGWNGVIELADASLLVAAEQGLHQVRGSRRTNILPSDGPEGLPLSLHRNDDHIWLGTTTGLFRVTASTPRFTFERVEGIAGPVASILQDRDGLVWAGTWGRGLYRIAGTRVDRWSLKEGLSDDFIHTLFEDREGNLWIGSRGGLSRWKNSPVVPYGITEGLKGHFASAVAGDGKGTLWFGTWRSGLYRLRDGAITRMPLPEPELTMLIRAITAAPDGSLWVAAWNHFYRFHANKWDRLRSVPGAVRALAADSSGDVLVGTSKGLYRTAGVTPLLADIPVTALRSSDGAELWIGTERGLFRRHSGSIDRIPNLENLSVTSISVDRSSRVWITSRSSGVAVLADGKVLARFDHRHGLPDLPFYQVLDDGSNSLWLSSPAGIWEVPMEQVEEMLAKRRTRFQPIMIGPDDGMPSIECQNVGQPNGWKTPDGSLWFPTVRGFVSIRSAHRMELGIPKVIIESVTKGPTDLAVRFTAPRLANPHQLRFRYRMDGVESGWIDAGQERTLRYNSLPPGTHRLLVSAREGAGPWSEPASLEVIQKPRFYQTWWLPALSIPLAGAIFYALYRWRVYLLKGKYSAVLAERNRIAREWHDTLLAGFSAISWQLDSTLNRLDSNPGKARQTVEVAKTMVHHYKAEARRVIWDLRNDGPDLENLLEAVEHAMIEITRETPVKAKVEVSGAVVRLEAEMRQNLLRICQEAAANAVRHAEASEILVRLSFNASEIRATITDDGKGFDPNQTRAGHFGIAIMRERAQRFGGRLEVQSEYGAGATVAAFIPIDQRA